MLGAFPVSPGKVLVAQTPLLGFERHTDRERHTEREGRFSTTSTKPATPLGAIPSTGRIKPPSVENSRQAFVASSTLAVASIYPTSSFSAPLPWRTFAMLSWFSPDAIPPAHPHAKKREER